MTRTIQVTINLNIRDDERADWYVASAEELETFKWSDDGTSEWKFAAIESALRCARNELRHFVRGGHVAISE